MSERDDSLDRALGAYAASTRGETLDSEALRRRILNDAAVPVRRKPRKLSFVVALAATFVASAAFAATQPAVRETLARSFEALFGASAKKPAPSRPAMPHGGPAPIASSAPAAASPPPESAPAPISPDDLPIVPRPSSSHAAAAAASAEPPSAPPASAATSASAAAFDAQVESYRKAHRLHFGGAPPAQTLAAWDEYLAAYPNASFATDARFNRALSLLRLGRRDEARAALRPFAEAPVGSYRQQEAASLLLSLESRAN